MAEAYTIADQERMTRAPNYFAWQARLVVPELADRVIEVGCGIGNFTGALLGKQAVVALDAEPACIERLNERYPGQANLRAMVCEPGSTAFAQLAAFGAGCCVCLNVLEHIEDDRGALQAMASILAPGGAIILLVPACASLYGPIDRNLGHFRRYGRASLTAVARAAGLRVEKMRSMNTAGFFGWWINARILRRQAQSLRQIAIFDRWIVPWLSHLESAAPPPFGQSLFAVLRKP